jgi:hypothetical protein
MGAGGELRDVLSRGVRGWSWCWRALAPALAAVADAPYAVKLRVPLSSLRDLVLTAVSVAIGVVILYAIANLALAGVIDMEKLLLGLSICCPGVTMVQFISPIPVVLEAVSKMSVANLPVQVFQSQAICNILGISYGIQIHNPAVLVTNLFGLGCQTMYLASDHYVRSSNTQWIWFVACGICIFNSGLYFFAQVSSITMLGHMITLFNVILFAAPLAKLGTILRTRSAASLPAAMIYISVLNNGSWTLFALLLDDMVLLLPSVLGYLLSAFQVLVILWCRGILAWDLSFLLLPCREHRDAQELEDPFGLQSAQMPMRGKRKGSQSDLVELAASPTSFGKPALAG